MNSEVTKRTAPTLYGSIKKVPQVDNTLTKEGCYADAKAVGDILRGEQRAVNFSYDANGNGLNANTIQEALDELNDVKVNTGYVDGEFEVNTLEDFDAKIDELDREQPVRKSGKYFINKKSYDDDFPPGDYFVEINKSWDGFSTVFAKGMHNGLAVNLRRVLYENNWRGWEWESPLLYEGIEYRTTEKWMGKPVYTKLVTYTPSNDIGKSDGIYGFAIEFSTPNFESIVRFNGSVNKAEGNAFPNIGIDGGFFGVNFMNSGGLALALNKKIIPGGTMITVQVWYTKTTD